MCFKELQQIIHVKIKVMHFNFYFVIGVYVTNLLTNAQRHQSFTFMILRNLNELVELEPKLKVD